MLLPGSVLFDPTGLSRMVAVRSTYQAGLIEFSQLD